LIKNTFEELEGRCPDYVEPEDWVQAVEDGRTFLATWGSKAAALGWLPTEIFGLAEVPVTPTAFYDRLARADQKGLVWHLHGRPVVELTAAYAAIEHKTGSITKFYRKDTNGQNTP
jgi:hypothetical protein